MNKTLKIAITADPEVPVPPLLYGGIERIIFGLTEAFSVAGHEVHLFANGESRTSAKLHPWKGKSSSSSFDTIQNARQLGKDHNTERFDIIHSFSRLAYLSTLLRKAVPKVMSYQREPTLKQIKLAYKLSKRNSLFFTGCSGYISEQIVPAAPASTIYNFIDTNFYTCSSEVADDAPLVFLGRIEPIKGTKEAIEIALKTQKQLIIAGNIPIEHTAYFEQHVRPFLSEQIKYIGAVNDGQKATLLEKAAALLMPIQWNEPFGIVMIEAMACGTPVIALNRGAVSEVILDTINGFKCETMEEMVNSVRVIKQINREQVRKTVEDNYSIKKVAEQYIELYQNMIAKGRSNG